ncbi:MULTISPECIES: glutaminase [Acinetobacter]|uniref:glutaminase n=1 Tax=Acinetobacter TaxID=469 RepID=UPI0002CE6397|nr:MULTISPECIES: glutaminase [Acinetobacter]AUC05735.1 glutaminase [Acinetobacter lwoffii]ENU63191.1 glutaminase A [Acinetobacter lwoffii NIPH 715]ENX21184.1 glutaminase A [Acinetobacter sp. CIP 102136]QXB84772.1 glutaminase [Acinetobacter lwoffii]
MKTPVPDYLQHVLTVCHDNDQGALADYIPELAAVDPNKFALALTTVDGTIYSTGDDETEFTMQSMSKPFAYALALQHLGISAVLEKVGVEPSGEAFNQISLDKETNLPKNPMINSGAITTHSLIPVQKGISRAECLRRFLSELAGRQLEFDKQVYKSEVKTAFRNLSIGYMLRTVGVLDSDPVEIVNGYIKQCAIKVTVKDLANICSVLANGGVQAKTGKQLLERDVVRQVLSVMMTCGMYDAAGDWLTTVGIPAKSGVSGGIIGVLPGQVGIVVFSPKIDEHGHSVRGVDIFERLSRDMGLHLMEGTPSAQTILQSRYTVGKNNDIVVYELRGVLQFTESEMLLRILQDEPDAQTRIVIDLTNLTLIHDVGARMLFEGVKRLQANGHKVVVIDSEGVLGEEQVKGNKRVVVTEELERYLEKFS